MSEYAYMSKDKSYALKHYGVKGMKWHKHLKRRFENEIGLSARREYMNSKKAEERVNEQTEINRIARKRMGARGANVSIVGPSPVKSLGSKSQNSMARQTEYRRQKYAKTPLGKIEGSAAGRAIKGAKQNADSIRFATKVAAKTTKKLKRLAYDKDFAATANAKVRSLEKSGAISSDGTVDRKKLKKASKSLMPLVEQPINDTIHEEKMRKIRKDRKRQERATKKRLKQREKLINKNKSDKARKH